VATFTPGNLKTVLKFILLVINFSKFLSFYIVSVELDDKFLLLN
jgi:hypothetical protein